MVPTTAFRKSALLLALSGAASVLGAQVQNSNLNLPSDAATNRQAVVDMFTNTFNAYKMYADGHDDLAPISKGYIDGRNGWGATIIDSLGTMFVMGLDDLFEEGVKFASGVDFSQGHTQDTVSVFETTIRYLGGLLSAYELSGEKYPVLLQKAQQVADKLAYAWTGLNVIPYGHIQPTSNEVVEATSNVAEAGTLTLEWYTLSQYTKNDTYRALAENSARHIANLPAPFPGLPAQGIDPATGLSVGSYVTWGGGTDSYLEYLIKYARLTNSEDPLWATTWATAVDSSIKNLKRTSTVGNWIYLSDWSDGKTIHVGSHLECFHAGNWMLGGRLLNNDTIVQTALALNDACWNTYESTLTGIGPEMWAFASSDGNYTGGTATQADLDYYNLHGYYPYDGYTYYYLRPEVLESNFMAWRVTGEIQYQERAASALKKFQTYLQAPAGYAGLNDVNNPSSGQIDDTESFWYAEVLKYLYLTFDDPDHISLDQYVFNTECQIFKTPPATSFALDKPTPTAPFVRNLFDAVVPLTSSAARLPDQLTNFISQFFF